MLDSLELKVFIRKQGSEYIAVTEEQNGNLICANTFQHDPAEFMLLDYPYDPANKEPASWIVRSLTKRKPRNPREMQAAQFGAKLYEYAFGNGRKFRDFLRTHREHVIRLNLVLTPHTAVLSRLPWEYLYDGRGFLCLMRNIQLIRQPEKIGASVHTSSPAPLRILALIASPDDQTALNSDSELSYLQDTLEPAVIGGEVELDVLSEATSFALRDVLHRKIYHVLYYIGQGKYDLMQQHSYLCFEDDVGHTDFVGAPQFRKLLGHNAPPLVILNGRSSMQSAGRDPYHSFALECLQQGIAALLNLPDTLHSDSHHILTQVLFHNLSKGQSVCDSIRAARKALSDRDEASEDDKRCDWGIPTCYIGAECVQPVSSAEPLDYRTDAKNKGRSSLIFVDRKSELQNLRKAFKENVSVIYLWGHSGTGKSTLIDQLLRHTGVRFKGILRVQCDELREPLSVLSKIANFWKGHTPVEHQQAADLLLDSRQDPFVRAQAAQQHIGQYHYLLIFENIHVWFGEANARTAAEGTGNISHPLIRSILLGMLHAQSSTTFLFTGTSKWADLSALPSTNRRDIPLPFLTPKWAYQLMSSLPGLNKLARKAKEAVYWQIGGHPLALKLLSAWCLSDHQDLESLLQDSPVLNRSTMDWIAYLLDDLIDHLDPGEAQVLPITAILNRPFSAKVLPNLTFISSPYAGALLNTWWNLELIEKTGVDEQYKFHSLVRNYILDRISADEAQQLHSQAAAYYGAPFMDEARRQIYTRNVSYPSEERVMWLARDVNGILGTWLRQEQNTERYQELLDLAMSWHYHLFYAGEYQAAVQIGRAVVPVLHHLGLRDLAAELLKHAISAADGYERAVSMDDFAKIRIADGQLVGALNVYEEVYKALLSHGTILQCAHVLARSARVQQQLGLWEDAIQRYEKALKVMRKEGEQRGQVICLYQLSVIYRQQQKLQQALVYSQAAKELYDKLVDDRGLASAAHEQGHILSDMNHHDGALENFAESMRLCRKLGDLACVAGNLYDIGDVLHKLGRTEMAIRALEEAENLYEMLDAPERADVLRLLEELYEKQQRLADAVQRFKAAKHSAAKK